MDDHRHLWKYQLLGIIAGVTLGFAGELPLALFTTESVEQIELPNGLPDEPPVIQTRTTQRYITGLPNVPAIGAVVGWLSGGMIWAVRGCKSAE